MKVGVIGNGYVGGAVAHGFSAASTGKCEVRVYDSIPDRSPHTLEETINNQKQEKKDKRNINNQRKLKKKERNINNQKNLKNS